MSSMHSDIMEAVRRSDGALSHEQVYHLVGEYPKDEITDGLARLVDRNKVALTADWEYKEVVKDA